MVLIMAPAHRLIYPIKDVKITIFVMGIRAGINVFTIKLSYLISTKLQKMTGVKQKIMAKVIKTWLQIKTRNVTKKGGNFS